MSLLPQIGKDEPVGMVVRQIACQNKLHNDQDDPERPILPDQVASSPAPGQQDGADHGRQVDDDIQEHQLVMDENPIGEESADDSRHNGQSGQDGCAEFPDIVTAEHQIQAEHQHRIENHLHMRHHAFHHGKDVAQEMIEERYMVHEMHACTQDGKQMMAVMVSFRDMVVVNHNLSSCKVNILQMQPGCKSNLCFRKSGDYHTSV